MKYSKGFKQQTIKLSDEIGEQEASNRLELLSMAH